MCYFCLIFIRKDMQNKFELPNTPIDMDSTERLIYIHRLDMPYRYDYRDDDTSSDKYIYDFIYTKDIDDVSERDNSWRKPPIFKSTPPSERSISSVKRIETRIEIVCLSDIHLRDRIGEYDRDVRTIIESLSYLTYCDVMDRIVCMAFFKDKDGAFCPFHYGDDIIGVQRIIAKYLL